MKEFDVLVLGGGAGGMMSAVYAKRRGLDVAIIESMMLGGTLWQIEKIENFPSYAEVSGAELAENFIKQIKHLGVEVINDEVLDVDFSAEKKVLVGKKEKYQAKSVIIASGLSYNKLGSNEEDFLGRGVSYCAVCDANFYKNKDVAVASKKGSGIKGALELANICKSVTILDSEDMSMYAKHNKNDKIKVLSLVKELKVEGKNFVEGVTFTVEGDEKSLPTSALFVELGKKPNTSLFKDLKLDENGYILTNEYMETSIKGVFAVGDIRAGKLKQLVCACSDGAIAGQNA